MILGAGVAGMAAATMAVGMHSEVFILDRNLDKLREVDHHFRGALETIASSEHAIEEVCLEADIVIGAVLVVGARAPRLVSDALVEQMRPGSVLVDISVDQGGCFESTRPTTHSNPTFEVHGSIFYCVANMPGAVPHTSTHALANATLPYTLSDRQPGLEARGPVEPRAGRRRERGRGPGRLPAGGRGPRDGVHAAGRAPGLSFRLRFPLGDGDGRRCAGAVRSSPAWTRWLTGLMVDLPTPEDERGPAAREGRAPPSVWRTPTATAQSLLLREHVVEGRLTLDEFSERMGRALEATHPGRARRRHGRPPRRPGPGCRSRARASARAGAGTSPS